MNLIHNGAHVLFPPFLALASEIRMWESLTKARAKADRIEATEDRSCHSCYHCYISFFFCNGYYAPLSSHGIRLEYSVAKQLQC